MKESEPSSTALLIAKGLIFAHGSPRVRALYRPGMASLSFALYASVSPLAARLFLCLGRLAPARALVRLIESLSVPGMILHYLLRKLRLEDFVSEALVSPSPPMQIVFLGAGLDTLGLRLARAHPTLRIFEIDHPATQSVKVRAIARGLVQAPQNFSLIPADLTRISAAEALAAPSSFRFDEATLFLAEGVFMYLTVEEVTDNLRILRRFPEGAASFVFTHMAKDADGRPAFRRQSRGVDGWLKGKREPFKWGMSQEELDDFLARRGFRSRAKVSGADLRIRYLSADWPARLPNAEGEDIAWVE